MGEPFTIRDFINNRWADAKEELLRRDPSFVKTLEAYVHAPKLGLLLPKNSKLPIPTTGLSVRWHKLLEATYDIVNALDTLHLNVTLLEHGIDRRLAVYHFDAWVQHVFNLCDKIRRQLVTLSCRQYFPGKQQEKGKQLIVHYSQQIKSKVQDEVDQYRSPLVHGAGGMGTLAQRAMTDQLQSWEIFVVGGDRMIDETLQAFYKSGHPEVDFSEILPGKTEFVVNTLGAILEDLEKDINSAKQSF